MLLNVMWSLLSSGFGPGSMGRSTLFQRLCRRGIYGGGGAGVVGASTVFSAAAAAAAADRRMG